ncbi:MAG: LamG domain-containing protein, partial [Planctomycetes bacterium]|nr:LamG domain-containing protein [Planctomycetota bacterium]
MISTIVAIAFASMSAPSPASDWDFSDQAEVIRDRTGSGNDLRFEGCEWVESKRGKALRIPAGSGRISCEKPSPALRPTTALSLIAWVRPLGTARYCAAALCGKGWGDDATAGYRLLVYQDGVRFLLKTGRVINISGGRITRGQWSQLAATYDGKEAVAFIDGEAVARDLLTGAIDYAGAADRLDVACADGGNLDGDILSLRLFDHALSEAEIAADWQAGKGICLTPEEITAGRYAASEKCSLASLPDAPFVRDRRTTLLAHMDSKDNCDADYSRWDGRAGGWRLKHGVSGRFGLAVELPGGGLSDLASPGSASRPTASGAPILYRGAGNCNMQRGTFEF